MKEQFVKSGCNVKIINGMPDHVHSLFQPSMNKAIADIIRDVKGSTAHHINQRDLIFEKFSWQSGYAAYSVSPSQVQRVYNYIKNQKNHHLNIDYKTEYKQLLKAVQQVDSF